MNNENEQIGRLDHWVPRGTKGGHMQYCASELFFAAVLFCRIPGVVSVVEYSINIRVR